MERDDAGERGRQQRAQVLGCNDRGIRRDPEQPRPVPDRVDPAHRHPASAVRTALLGGRAPRTERPLPFGTGIEQHVDERDLWT